MEKYTIIKHILFPFLMVVISTILASISKIFERKDNKRYKEGEAFTLTQPKILIVVSLMCVLLSIGLTLLIFFQDRNAYAWFFLCISIAICCWVMCLYGLTYKVVVDPKKDYFVYKKFFTSKKYYYKDCTAFVTYGNYIQVEFGKTKKRFSYEINNLVLFSTQFHENNIKPVAYKLDGKENVYTVKAPKPVRYFFFVIIAYGIVMNFIVIMDNTENFSIPLATLTYLKSYIIPDLLINISIVYLLLSYNLKEITVYRKDNYFIYKSLIKKYKIDFDECKYYRIILDSVFLRTNKRVFFLFFLVKSDETDRFIKTLNEKRVEARSFKIRKR